MARPLRIEIADGLYHVTVRGWERRVIVRRGEAKVRYGGWYSWTNGWRTWDQVQAAGGEVNSQLTLKQRQPTQVQCPSP